VRTLTFSPPSGRAAVRRVAMFPGLGLPRYLLPLAHALAASGAEVSVFDALAFRHRRHRVTPTVLGLAEAGAQWLGGLPQVGPVCVLGHSTGAQVALEAVLAVPPSVGVDSLVMAGPTFAPSQRRLRRLAPAALRAYRRDTPKELVVVRDLARVRTDVVRIVLSGLRHRPEARLPLVSLPLTVTAGESDAFAPRPWLEELSASGAGPSRVVVLPGSHNNVFPHAPEVATVVLEALPGAGLSTPPSPG
jgi:pimeloyl-ACP methyl ester carboxylesterase